MSGDEADSVLQEIRAHYPFTPPAPVWLPQEFADLIIACVRFLGGDSGKKDFLGWAAHALAEPKGRPAKGELTRIHKEAARMRKTLGRNRRPPSWMTITRKLCPQRSEGGHKCTKVCVDRIRQGAARYE
jgi:hypothetical protein